MIDVIRLILSNIQTDNLLDNGDQIFVAENAGRFIVRNVEVETAVDLVPSDAAEVITVKIKKHRVDEVACVVGRCEISGTDALIDLF